MSDRENHKVSNTGQDWHRRSCYGCGPDNPHGLHADFRFYEPAGEVRFRYRPEPHQEGAPGYMHGGVIAALFDEAQGVLCFHLGHFVMTDHLSVNYEHAIPLSGVIHFRCWVTAVRRRRIYTSAEITDDDGRIHAVSSGRWYLINEKVAYRMFYKNHSQETFEELKQILEGNRKRAKEIRKRLRKK